MRGELDRLGRGVGGLRLEAGFLVLAVGAWFSTRSKDANHADI